MRTQTALGVTRRVRNRMVATFPLVAPAIRWNDMFAPRNLRPRFVSGSVMQNTIGLKVWIVRSVIESGRGEGM